ncbi:DMT family transporter [Desulfovibrio oxamicus]|uniref:DMT family transporter n=1 Tax=Nitratidesulfovibrio oxamicus TaxID=32016 RepID=A0ABS0J9P3_9BACT|nr:DMT family transporter [Nitratidesulfovibrio oxamicus]MBG3879109.1 DMT family transporter [Nitratidesulfovibrio oxamicus]
MPAPRTAPVSSATLALLLAMLLWSSSFIAMKVALEGFHPMVVVFGRMGISSAVFLALWRNFRHVRYRKGDWKRLGAMALCEPCLYFVFEAYALRYTSASQAGMIVSVMPLCVAVAAWIVLGERLARRVWSGFVLAIIGVVWLSLGGASSDNAPNPLLGNLLELCAMVSATGYVINAKKLSATYPPLFITAVQSLAGSAFFLPLLFLPTTQLPDAFPLLPTLSVIYLGTCISLGAYGLYNFGVSRLPAGQASAFINLIPVITLLMGRVLLGDQLTPQQYAASVLVLVGVLLSQGRGVTAPEKTVPDESAPNDPARLRGGEK